MKKVIAAALVTTTFMSCTAFADEGLELAKEKQCLSCHAVDKESLAPSLQSIAQKYRGVRNAKIAIFNVIAHGTSAHETFGPFTGVMRMPPPSAQAPVSVDEANKLVDWIQNLK